jgi:predicted O-methyltransferase YrrM
MAARARKNFKRAGVEEQIKIRVSDALEEIKAIPPPFDLIFMDIEKIDYYAALPYCRDLLRQNGLLIADNVGFEDADLFNKAIFSSNEFRPVSLFSFLPLHSPEKDGLCLALRL